MPDRRSTSPAKSLAGGACRRPSLALLTAASEGGRARAGRGPAGAGRALSSTSHFPSDGIISLLAVMRQGDAIETATVGREGAVGLLSRLGPRRSHTPRRGPGRRHGDAHRGRTLPQSRRGAARRSATSSSATAKSLLIQVQQTAACNALHDVEERLSRWLLQARDRVDGQHHPPNARIPVADARACGVRP